jgi:hypothetical protein
MAFWKAAIQYQLRREKRTCLDLGSLPEHQRIYTVTDAAGLARCNRALHVFRSTQRVAQWPELPR